MKIIVTGSHGVIGSQIVSDLKKKINTEVIELDYKLGHDLSNEKYVVEFFSKTPADALVNCFVVNDHIKFDTKKKSFMDYPLENFSKSFNINVTALFSVCREFIRNNSVGKIVNFSSIYGYRSPKPSLYLEHGGDKDPSYGSSKAAVSNLTKYLAVHAPKFNINCIVPGGIENGQSSSFQSKYSQDLPIARMMDRKEITGLVRFLLSEDSSYCTGGEFFLDGGWNAR
jgi:NAD(P)-dependent dehydrogenase (short-subunit alcohol dehydrogenase family)